MAYESETGGPDRFTMAWRRKWAILIFAVLVAAVVGTVLAQAAPRYSTRATIQVNLLQTKGVAQSTALAANELAAQYAQLATSQAVLNAAAGTLGADASGLAGAISAAPVNNYNIVAITATSTSPVRSARQADATARALVAYVDDVNAKQVLAVEQSGAARRDALDSDIGALRTQIARNTAQAAAGGPRAPAAATEAASARSLLATLTSQRENIFTSSQRDLAVSQPNLVLVDLPERGSAISRRLPAYVAGAFLVGLLLAVEFATVVARVRRRVVTQRSDSQSDWGRELEAGSHRDSSAASEVERVTAL
jgi:Chain length determinant protein